MLGANRESTGKDKSSKLKQRFFNEYFDHEDQPIMSSMSRLEKLDQIQFNSMLDFVKSLGNVFGEENALCLPVDDQVSEFENMNYFELVARSFRLARFFKMREISRIVVISEATLNYPPLVLGAWCAGVALVPLDVKLTLQEKVNLIQHADPEVIIFSQIQAEEFSERPDLLNQIPDFILIDDIHELPDFKHIQLTHCNPKSTTAAIIYTSGTTGEPKGVMVSHETVLFQTSRTAEEGRSEKKERFLFMLPLNHLFGLVSALIYPFSIGGEQIFVRSIDKDHLITCLKVKQATQLITVPLLVDGIRKGIATKIKAQSLLKKSGFSVLKQKARLSSDFAQRRKIFAMIHESFGGALERIIVGGAPVKKSTIDFFSTIGLPIYEGYGITETGPVISVNRVDDWKPGSVGKPFAGIEVKINEPNDKGEGEIYTRGPHIMQGYFKNPTLTEQALTKDSWYKTGDFGFIHRDGYLYVRGRIKRMIVLNSGKKVHSEEIEQLLTSLPEIGEVCVFGLKDFDLKAKTEEVVAVIIPDKDIIMDRLEKSELDPSEVESLIADLMKNRLEVLAQFKRPTRTYLSFEELPKTTTLKIRPHKVAEKIQASMKAGQLKTSESLNNFFWY